MLKVVAKGFFYEEKVDQALKLYEELVRETQKEVGCISYNLYQDVNDRSILTVLEEWENVECLENHIKTEHFSRIVPEISKLRISAEINKYKLMIW